MTDVEQEGDRLRTFRAQLVLQGESLSAFAANLGVQSNHVRLVLQGKRDSKRIEEAVASWYTEHGLRLPWRRRAS